MDNQQAKFAYIAGLIDGEGCLDFMTNKRDNKSRYVPRVRLVMTHFETLEKLKELIHSTGLPFWTEEKRRVPANKNWSPSWGLTITGIKRIKQWSEKISPYSLTKEKEWKILKEYIQSRLSRNTLLGSQVPYTQREIELVQEMKQCKMPQRLHAEHRKMKV